MRKFMFSKKDIDHEPIRYNENIPGDNVLIGEQVVRNEKKQILIDTIKILKHVKYKDDTINELRMYEWDRIGGGINEVLNCIKKGDELKESLSELDSYIIKLIRNERSLIENTSIVEENIIAKYRDKINLHLEFIQESESNKILLREDVIELMTSQIVEFLSEFKDAEIENYNTTFNNMNNSFISRLSLL